MKNALVLESSALAAGPESDTALCFPTEQYKVVPANLDPDELPPKTPIQIKDVDRYPFESGPANLKDTDERLFCHGVPLCDETLKKTGWVYMTALAVGHNAEQQWEHLKAGLFQALPAKLLARANATLKEVRETESCELNPKNLGDLAAKRILGSNTLKLNKDGARDKWSKVDAMILEEVKAKEAVTGEGLLNLVQSINKGQYGEEDNGGMEAAGVIRGTAEEAGPTPVSGSENKKTLRCFGKKGEEDNEEDVLVNGRNDNDLSYLSNEAVPSAMEDLTKWAATQMESLDNIIVTAAVFMVGLASIHPFHDVNGRTARQSMDFLFMKAGLLPPTDFNVMVAIFPRLDHCTNPSPVAAVNEVIKGLRNTCGLEPLSISDVNVKKCSVSIHCGQMGQPSCVPPKPWAEVPKLEYTEPALEPCKECCGNLPAAAARNAKLKEMLANGKCPRCNGCAEF